MSTLYLIPTERALYDKLPAKLKKQWGGKVVDETGAQWEREEDYLPRIQRLQKLMKPKEKLALQKTLQLMNQKGFNGFTAKDFPKKIFPYVLMSLGALGLTGAIDGVLRSASSLEDLIAISDFADARHQLLLSRK